MSLLDHAHRVLFIHAHPDDETLSTGALIVHLRSRGIACDLVTATRGEEGEVVSGPLSHLEGTEELHAHRVRELAGALSELGVERHAFLGNLPARAHGCAERLYRDSGMQWVGPGVAGPADTSDGRSLCAGDIDEQVADLIALVNEWRPDLMVSYDEHGGYGHPDHVRMHRVAAAASEATGVSFAEIRHQNESGVEWFDLPETLPRVATALRHHASQLTVQDGGTDVVHSGGQREAIVTAVGLSLRAD